MSREFEPRAVPRLAPESATLVEVLTQRAIEQAEDTAFAFVDRADCTTKTYREIDFEARTIAAHLVERGLRGERAMLIYPPGEEFITAFLGCLYAGVLAVPVYPPDPRSLERTLPRLLRIGADAQPAALLTTTQIAGFRELLVSRAAELGKLDWLATDPPPAIDVAGFEPLGADPENIAFLQYTSGSTSDPRGVMVTHGNLSHNLRLIFDACEGDPFRDLSLLWLPTYHDMGLIGGALLPLYAGGTSMLMSPLRFMRKPIEWLRAMSRYRATISGAPNFAFDLCVRRAPMEDLTGLDLSHWRLSFCGAEPIRQETLDRFIEVFAPYGLRPEVFYPCYGLAESTLMVTGADWRVAHRTGQFDRVALEERRAVAADAEGIDLVSCGRPQGGLKVAIVDPETLQRCEAGQVGEIWISGGSVTRGYWRGPNDTRPQFTATIAGEGKAHFLRTGDLGFLDGGELFVAGRIKDLIIIRGRNVLPQDIEYALEQEIAELRPGCGAAFSIDHAGEEKLVVVFEVESEELEPELVVSAMRDTVATRTGLTLFDVVLLCPRTIPKTSSGKIRRRAAREGYLMGTLETFVPAREENAA